MSDEPIEIRRTFRSSPQIGQLAAALAVAQGKMEGAKKDAANPFFKSKYADLASVWDCVRGPLSENGLACLQFPRATPDGIEVETMLCHSSGEWVSESLALPSAKYDAQGLGSAITYARRYGLQSICGVAPEDDDGNAAVQGSQKAQESDLQKATKILDVAVKDGLTSLETAWKALSPAMRQAVGVKRLNEYKDKCNAGDAHE